MSDQVSVINGSTVTELPADTVPDADHPAIELTTNQRIDYVANSLAVLHANHDRLERNVYATYQAVTRLVDMLSAVQKVAAMMPGPAGKAVRAMAKNMDGKSDDPSHAG